MLGRPIGHSLSPVLHRAAYRALGLDWAFAALDCGADDLAALLRRSGPEWVGFCCTMPLKRQVVALADEVSARAAAVGAGNTLLRQGAFGGPEGAEQPAAERPGAARWRADNTDVAGILGALAERGVGRGGAPARAADGAAPGSASARGAGRAQLGSVTVLGAGGTAQAAVAALAEIGVTRCRALVRDRSRTAPLLATAERVGARVELGELTASDRSLGADLVISALPPRAADPLTAFAWSSRQTVLDVCYDQWPTALARSVAAAGGTVLSGAAMLLHQAAAQVELMTGRAAPVSAMRAALRRAVPNAGL
ncbi:MAG: shikimate dehydrogenase [Actinomycetia bacterium]|nr:shikimate dehydrogenase [Actinomycetes bacterium]